MARGRPGGWERRRKAEGPPFARPRREPGPGRDAELLARLARLESLLLAIAAHLGIESQPGGRREARRPGRMPGARAERPRSLGPDVPQPAGDAHTVVRTVARGRSGRLKQYNPDRGYGFVVSADGPEDIFFHRSDCRADPEALQPSASVTFDVVEMANGQFKATNLDTR